MCVCVCSPSVLLKVRTCSCRLFSRTLSIRRSYCCAWSALKLKSLSSCSFSPSRRCTHTHTHTINNTITLFHHSLAAPLHRLIHAVASCVVITCCEIIQIQETPCCFIQYVLEVRGEEPEPTGGLRYLNNSRHSLQAWWAEKHDTRMEFEADVQVALAHGVG